MNDLTTQSQETDAANNESIKHRGLETAARSRAGFVRNPCQSSRDKIRQVANGKMEFDTQLTAGKLLNEAMTEGTGLEPA